MVTANKQKLQLGTWSECRRINQGLPVRQRTSGPLPHHSWVGKCRLHCVAGCAQQFVTPHKQGLNCWLASSRTLDASLTEVQGCGSLPHGQPRPSRELGMTGQPCSGPLLPSASVGAHMPAARWIHRRTAATKQSLPEWI